MSVVLFFSLSQLELSLNLLFSALDSKSPLYFFWQMIRNVTWHCLNAIHCTTYYNYDHFNPKMRCFTPNTHGDRSERGSRLKLDLMNCKPWVAFSNLNSHWDLLPFSFPYQMFYRHILESNVSNYCICFVNYKNKSARNLVLSQAVCLRLSL